MTLLCDTLSMGSDSRLSIQQRGHSRIPSSLWMGDATPPQLTPLLEFWLEVVWRRCVVRVEMTNASTRKGVGSEESV